MIQALLPEAILCFISMLVLIGGLVVLFTRWELSHPPFSVLWFVTVALWLRGQVDFQIFQVSPLFAVALLSVTGFISIGLIQGRTWSKYLVLFLSSASVLFNCFIAWFVMGQTMWFHENENLPYSMAHLFDGFFPISMSIISIILIVIVVKKGLSEPSARGNGIPSPQP